MYQASHAWDHANMFCKFSIPASKVSLIFMLFAIPWCQLTLCYPMVSYNPSPMYAHMYVQQ